MRGSQVKACASWVMATVARDAARRGRSRRCPRSMSASAASRRASSGRAQVDRELRVAGDDVGRAGPDVHPPDGRDEIGLGAGAAPRSSAPSRPRRRRRRGAAPSASRRRGRPCPSTPTSSRVAPLIAVTTPSGRPSASSTGPCSIWASTKAATWSRAKRTSPCPDRRRTPSSASRIADAGGVLLVERVLRIVAGERARAGERGAIAHALLVAEGDDLDRVVEPLAARARAPRRPRARRARRNCRRSGRRRAPCRCASRASAPARRPRCLRSARRRCRRRRCGPASPASRAPADEGRRGAPVRVGEEEARQPAAARR